LLTKQERNGLIYRVICFCLVFVPARKNPKLRQLSSESPGFWPRFLKKPNIFQLVMCAGSQLAVGDIEALWLQMSITTAWRFHHEQNAALNCHRNGTWGFGSSLGQPNQQ
jgi:hypothetical protein